MASPVHRLTVLAPRSSLLNGLVAYWPLDEASGSRFDLVGGNTLADNNTVTQTPGKVGNAAQFTAANSEYLDIADNAALSMGDIDFEIGIGVLLDAKVALRFALSKRLSAGSGTPEYQIWYDNSADRLVFSVVNGTTLVSATANNFGSPGTATWHHVHAWHDSAGDVIGISVNNGAANTTAHSAGVFDGTGNFHLGRNWNGGTLYWDGALDDVKIWKGRILTASERAEDYANFCAGRALV